MDYSELGKDLDKILASLDEVEISQVSADDSAKSETKPNILDVSDEQQSTSMRLHDFFEKLKLDEKSEDTSSGAKSDVTIEDAENCLCFQNYVLVEEMKRSKLAESKPPVVEEKVETENKPKEIESKAIDAVKYAIENAAAVGNIAREIVGTAIAPVEAEPVPVDEVKEMKDEEFTSNTISIETVSTVGNDLPAQEQEKGPAEAESPEVAVTGDDSVPLEEPTELHEEEIHKTDEIKPVDLVIQAQEQLKEKVQSIETPAAATEIESVPADETQIFEIPKVVVTEALPVIPELELESEEVPKVDEPAAAPAEIESVPISETQQQETEPIPQADEPAAAEKPQELASEHSISRLASQESQHSLASTVPYSTASNESLKIQPDSTTDETKQPLEEHLKVDASIKDSFHFQNYGKDIEYVAFTQLPEELGAADMDIDYEFVKPHSPELVRKVRISDTVEVIPDEQLELTVDKAEETKESVEDGKEDLIATEKEDEACPDSSFVVEKKSSENIETEKPGKTEAPKPTEEITEPSAPELENPQESIDNKIAAVKNSVLNELFSRFRSSRQSTEDVAEQNVKDDGKSEDVRSSVSKAAESKETSEQPLDQKEVESQLLDETTYMHLPEPPVELPEVEANTIPDDMELVEVCVCVKERYATIGEELPSHVLVPRKAIEVSQPQQESDDKDLALSVSLCECAQERMYGLDYLNQLPRVVGYIMNQEKEAAEANESVADDSKAAVDMKVVSSATKVLDKLKSKASFFKRSSYDIQKAELSATESLTEDTKPAAAEPSTPRSKSNSQSWFKSFGLRKSTDSTSSVTVEPKVSDEVKVEAVPADSTMTESPKDLTDEKIETKNEESNITAAEGDKIANEQMSATALITKIESQTASIKNLGDEKIDTKNEESNAIVVESDKVVNEQTASITKIESQTASVKDLGDKKCEVQSAESIPTVAAENPAHVASELKSSASVSLVESQTSPVEQQVVDKVETVTVDNSSDSVEAAKSAEKVKSKSSLHSMNVTATTSTPKARSHTSFMKKLFGDKSNELIRGRATSDLRLVSDEVPEKVDVAKISKLDLSAEDLNMEASEKNEVASAMKFAGSDLGMIISSKNIKNLEQLNNEIAAIQPTVEDQMESNPIQRALSLESIESLQKADSLRQIAEGMTRNWQSDPDVQKAASVESTKSTTKRARGINTLFRRLTSILGMGKKQSRDKI